MNKIISFCLWGRNPKYTIGAIKNAQLAKTIFPDWKCRFYVGQSVPWSVITSLHEHNAEVVHMPEAGDWKGMFWRFLPANDPHIDVFISRDTDSRLDWSEKTVIDQWLSSSYSVLALGQHPWHTVPLMGGGWGMKKNAVPNFTDLLSQWNREDRYQTDQEFLNSAVWPLVQKNTLMYHICNYGWSPGLLKPWPPVKRSNVMFFGQVFDESDLPVKEHIDAYCSYITAGKSSL